MAGFLFKLETPNGEPAEPSSLSSAVPNWAPGETIHVGHRTVRVVGGARRRADEPPVLVVEIWPNDRVASSDLEPHRWNEGPGGLWGHCGRRSCPTYDTGSPGSGPISP